MDERFYPQEPPDSPVDKPEKEYEPDTQCPELNGTCTGEQHPGVHTSPVYFWGEPVKNIKPIVCDCGCIEGKLSEKLTTGDLTLEQLMAIDANFRDADEGKLDRYRHLYAKDENEY